MKKFLFLFILTVATSAFTPKVFAQFSWRVAADLHLRMLAWNVPIGERAEKFIQVDDSSVYNDGTNNPGTLDNPFANFNRGDYTYTAGTLDILNSEGNEVTLNLDYRTPSFMFHTQTNIAGMVGTLTASRDSAPGSGGTPNWADFLRYSFSEWFIRGNFNFLSVYVGNTGDVGKVPRFLNFGDVVGREDNYGVFTPNLYTADCINTSTNVMGMHSLTFNQNRHYAALGVPYFMTAVRVEELFAFPLTFQIAADAGSNNMPGVTFNYKNIGGTMRVSGERVGAKINFDVIYKIRGGDPNTLDSYDPEFNAPEPDGTGFIAHAFGLYANILGVPKFGMGIGYSGYVRSYEDRFDPATERTTTKTGPLFSGFDLRFEYTGIRNMAITLHNNVSYTHARKSSATNIATGVWGQELPADTEQDWFALYNTLGLDYRLNPRVTFSFQITNRYGLVSTGISPPDTDTHQYKIKRGNTRLAGGASASLRFNGNLLFQGGFAFNYTNNSYSNTAAGAQNDLSTRDASGGMFRIAIPIGMMMNLRP